MRIQYNGAAMTAARNLNIVWNKQASLSEKISSGYRINRAADDAAGLKISEKMRGQIRGLRQASQNAQDGISMLQTADGALNEVHSMLQRVRELSVQAANDTNTLDDRKSIQEEIDQLLEEVNRITGQTEFNTRKIFDGSLQATDSPYTAAERGVYFLYGSDEEFAATQSPAGGSGVGGYTALSNVLDKEIVPQAVNALLNTYSEAFGYLKDSSTGIGLIIVNDSSSSALASVSLTPQFSGEFSSDGEPKYNLGFQLKVNASYLGLESGNLTGDNRRALETTVLHEMVHGIMDEALTNGMLGISGGVQNTSYEFPGWFIEGMAQTASGGYSNDNDWVNGGLRIDTSTSESDITSIVRSSANRLTNASDAHASYGTGYLACMYLGQLASGKGVGEEEISVSSIKTGLNSILKKLTAGQSLDEVIKEVTGGAYTSSSDVANKFGDDKSAKFIYNLTHLVGNGNGSLVTGSFTSTDLLPNSATDSTLLDLNPSAQQVYNGYPDDVTVLSGGTKSAGGPAPIEDYGVEDPGTPTTGGADINLSSLTSGSGSGYTFDGSKLRISGDGDYSIKGSKGGISIVIEDGVTAKITVDGASVTSSGSAFEVGSGSDVTLEVKGTCKMTGGSGAGIHVENGGSLTITGAGKLTATAGSSSGAAGIGGLSGEASGTITIDGTSGGELVVTAQGGTGANGTGAGKGATGGTINQTCGILIDTSSRTGTITGNVTITDKVDTKGASLTVDKDSVVTVTSSGSIVNGSGTATIDVLGQVKNRGSIGDKITIVTSGGSKGTVEHDISSVTYTKPQNIKGGSKYLSSETATASVTFNGNKRETVSGTWTVKDSSGNTISNPTGETAEEGKTYTYSVTYKLSTDQIAKGMKFTNDTAFRSSYEHVNEMLQYKAGDADISPVTAKSVSLDDTSVATDGTYITLTYRVSAEEAAPSGGGTGGLTGVTSGFMLQVGANSKQGMSVDIDKLNTTELGLDGLSVSSHEDADNSIDIVDKAISKVSSVRSRIGAYQNRLEYTIENLDNTAENLETAESRIRDLDIASAMVEYAKNQILIQAAQAMIVQANQSPNGILQLLQ